LLKLRIYANLALVPLEETIDWANLFKMTDLYRRIIPYVFVIQFHLSPLCFISQTDFVLFLHSNCFQGNLLKQVSVSITKWWRNILFINLLYRPLWFLYIIYSQMNDDEWFFQLYFDIWILIDKNFTQATRTAQKGNLICCSILFI